MLQARNIWELVVRAGRGLARPRDGHRRDGQPLTFGEYRDRCRAGRRRAGGPGRGRRRRRVVGAADWHEALVLFGALRRLGAVQNPIIPIYRDREVGFIVRQAGPTLLVVPVEWRGFDYAAMAARRHRGHRHAEVLVPRPLAARGRPGHAAPGARRRHARPRADEPVAAPYYTSGTTAEPKGARHGDRSLRPGLGRHVRAAAAWPTTTGSPWWFPFTHIAGASTSTRRGRTA